MAALTVDDVDALRGEFTEADFIGVPLMYDGREVRLDLTAANKKVMDEVLTPWLEAGRPVVPAQHSEPVAVCVGPPITIPVSPPLPPLPRKPKKISARGSRAAADPARRPETAMQNRAGSWVSHPDIQRFCRENGMRAPGGAAFPTHPVLVAYAKARKDGTFVPDSRKYRTR